MIHPGLLFIGGLLSWSLCLVFSKVANKYGDIESGIVLVDGEVKTEYRMTAFADLAVVTFFMGFGFMFASIFVSFGVLK